MEMCQAGIQPQLCEWLYLISPSFIFQDVSFDFFCKCAFSFNLFVKRDSRAPASTEEFFLLFSFHNFCNSKFHSPYKVFLLQAQT